MCNLHPGKTYERPFTDGHICIECKELRLTKRCPRCRKGSMVRPFAECPWCCLYADVFHQGVPYWLEPRQIYIRIRSELLWWADNAGQLLGRVDVPGARKVSRWISERVMREGYENSSL